jgi:putative ABC transport system substrate-binding protein
MRRRQFITLLGGATVLWPFVARAQRPPNPVVGYLSTASPAAFTQFSEAFQRGLKDVGYVDGQNLAIEYRWAEGHYDRLPAMAADLVARKVAVIASTGGPPAVEAAAAATSTVPIVFLSSDNVLRQGIVASLNRPGGNITGVAMSIANLASKCLQFISEVLPKNAPLAMLVNPNDSETTVVTGEIEAAVRQLGIRLNVVSASNEKEIDQAFAKIAEQHTGGLIVQGDALFTSRRDQIVQLAARNSLPTIYMWSEFPTSGGLMSYGNNLLENYRQVGNYTGRILKGEKPADLPVMQPTKFEFVINLKTAQALGLTLPQALLVAADKVIE